MYGYYFYHRRGKLGFEIQNEAYFLTMLAFLVQNEENINLLSPNNPVLDLCVLPST
jgi:hypothetical protein